MTISRLMYDADHETLIIISTALVFISFDFCSIVSCKKSTTECDYEVPEYMKFDRELTTLAIYDVYGSREKVLAAIGTRNKSYLRSSEYDYANPKTHPTCSIDHLLATGENDTKELPAESKPVIEEDYSRDSAYTIPVISLWPGWTPFTFDFPTPPEMAFRPEITTASDETVCTILEPDWSDPNEPLRWDHLTHTPKMVVIDFDYTLTNFTTDLMLPPLERYEPQNAAADHDGFLFVPHDDVRRILKEVRAKGVKTALIGKEKRPQLVHDFLNLTHLDSLFDIVHIYYDTDENCVTEYLQTISRMTNVKPRDMIFFDEDFQNLKDAFNVGATPIRCYNGITMKRVNRCLNLHNDFKTHGVLPEHLFYATGIPGVPKEEFEDPENPIWMTTLSPEEYKKEYDKHIETLNKKLKPGHPPFPRITKWYKK